MKKKIMALTIILAALLAGCSGQSSDQASNNTESIRTESENAPEVNGEDKEEKAETEEKRTVRIGICNYVDDASLNQIYENITERLGELGEEENIDYVIDYDNCNADSNVLNQIISNFISDKTDLMVGIATPVAMAMQNATEENEIPVIFSAVSDPEGAGLVDSNEHPGHNITGTSDYLNTDAIMNLIFEENPDTDLVGLLYDIGQDSSTQAINDAKAYLDSKGIKYIERTGTNVDEIMLACEALVSDKVDCVFTPSDNTVMTAELSVYETLAENGIKHYAGADSFALNGAFLGYGVDYANLGRETADMINEIFTSSKKPADMPVKTFDNGIATINTDVAEILGVDVEDVKNKFSSYCTSIQEIQTAEEF